MLRAMRIVALIDATTATAQSLGTVVSSHWNHNDAVKGREEFKALCYKCGAATPLLRIVTLERELSDGAIVMGTDVSQGIR